MYFLIVSWWLLTKAETCSKQQTDINVIVNGGLYLLFAVVCIVVVVLYVLSYVYLLHYLCIAVFF